MTQEHLVQRTAEGQQLLAVREILRATAAALPLAETLSVIANTAIIALAARTSWLMLAEDGRLRTAVARGELAAGLEGSSGADGSLSCAAALRERPLIVQPAEIDPADPLAGTFSGQEGALALLPLRVGERRLGLLGLALAPAASPDIPSLVTIAEQAASAIENARLREEARTWRERLDVLFERMAEPVFVYDARGRLALLNDASEELLAGKGVQIGDTLAEVLAKSGLGDTHGCPLPPQETAIARALRGERVENLELTLPVAGGPTRHLLMSVAPLSVDGQIQGVVAVGRDITYIKELERMRAEFLSMVSHELRSPLTSIMGYAQLLERQAMRGETPRDLEKRLGVIVEQSRRVNKLVGDLLEASQAEAGRLALDLREIDLAELLGRAVHLISTLSPDHTYSLDLPPQVPQVLADPVRIEQVLMNLLSNAAKYSPPGTEVTVRLQARPESLLVSVQDQGMGVSHEDMATLFLPFHRVRQVRGREIKGVGLGLFVSQAIVEAHGGEMWAESQLGKGSTFYLTLPRT